MANEQTIADLRAVLSAHGFKETEEAMRAVKIQTGGVASGLKSLTDVMNKGSKETKGFGLSTQKTNQMVQQLSFGLQDFAITIGQGGLGMALRSASNNAAQMGAIMGGIGGAVAGLGVTFASLIPDIFRMFSSTDKATESLKKHEAQQKLVKQAAEETAAAISRLAEQLDKIGRDRKLGNLVQELGEMAPGPAKFKRVNKEVEDAQKAFEDAQKKIAVVRRQRDDNPDLLGQTKEDDLARTLRTRGRKAALEQAAREFKGQNPEDVVKRIEDENRIGRMLGVRQHGEAPKPSGVGFGKMDEGVARERQKGIDRFTKEMDDAQKSAAAAAEKLRRLRKIREEAEDIEANPNDPRGQMGRQRAEKNSKDAATRAKVLAKRIADEDKDREAERKRLAREQEQRTKRQQADAKKGAADFDRQQETTRKTRLKGLESEKKDLQSILKVTDPVGAGLQKIQEEFEGIASRDVGRALGKNPLDLFGAMMAGAPALGAGAKAQQEFLKKQQPGITGTFGVADFSRQLQNALLKDDTSKMIQHNTADIKKSTAATVDRLKDINKGIADLKSAKGVFGP